MYETVNELVQQQPQEWIHNYDAICRDGPDSFVELLLSYNSPVAEKRDNIGNGRVLGFHEFTLLFPTSASLFIRK